MLFFLLVLSLVLLYSQVGFNRISSLEIHRARNISLRGGGGDLLRIYGGMGVIHFVFKGIYGPLHQRFCYGWCSVLVEG